MQVFMLSNGKLPTSKVMLDYALDDIKSAFARKKVKNVLVIPYAVIRFTYDKRVETVQESLAGLDLNIEGIHNFKDPVLALEWADAIMVSGGNTWQLTKSLHDFGLIEPLRKAVLKEDKIYVGWSAGSVICAPTMCTTNDMCIVDAAITASLNFVPFQINPHYIDASIENHMGETRDERILEFCIQNPHKTVLGIPEGSWLHLHDDGLDYHCPLGKPFVEFKFGQEKRTLQQQDLTAYLK